MHILVKFLKGFQKFKKKSLFCYLRFIYFLGSWQSRESTWYLFVCLYLFFCFFINFYGIGGCVIYPKGMRDIR